MQSADDDDCIQVNVVVISQRSTQKQPNCETGVWLYKAWGEKLNNQRLLPRMVAMMLMLTIMSQSLLKFISTNIMAAILGHHL